MDKQTYTIHETKGKAGLAVAISYPYTGTLRGAKRRASLDQGWEGSTLTISLDGHKVSIRGHYGWYDLPKRQSVA